MPRYTCDCHVDNITWSLKNVRVLHETWIFRRLLLCCALQFSKDVEYQCTKLSTVYPIDFGIEPNRQKWCSSALPLESRHMKPTYRFLFLFQFCKTTTFQKHSFASYIFDEFYVSCWCLLDDTIIIKRARSRNVDFCVALQPHHFTVIVVGALVCRCTWFEKHRIWAVLSFRIVSHFLIFCYHSVVWWMISDIFEWI